MTDAPAPRGWLLRADDDEFDIGPMLERFGQVYRYPVTDDAAAATMTPGTPCFLYRTNRSKVVGLWAIGEVVAPCLEVAGDDGTVRTYAEVELLPLEKPIASTKLAADKVLARGVLGGPLTGENPIPLSSEEIRAIESFDFWMADPSDEQRDRLDALLAAEEAAG